MSWFCTSPLLILVMEHPTWIKFWPTDVPFAVMWSLQLLFHRTILSRIVCQCEIYRQAVTQHIRKPTVVPLTEMLSYITVVHWSRAILKGSMCRLSIWSIMYGSWMFINWNHVTTSRTIRAKQLRNEWARKRASKHKTLVITSACDQRYQTNEQ